MKETGIRIASVFMALLLLVSTTSFVVIDRYCSGDLIESSLIDNEDSCAGAFEATVGDNCCTTKDTDCCGALIYTVEACDQLFVNTDKLPEIGKKKHLAVITSAVQQETLIFPHQLIPHNNYIPPTLIYEKTVINQVFRI